MDAATDQAPPLEALALVWRRVDPPTTSPTPTASPTPTPIDAGAAPVRAMTGPFPLQLVGIAWEQARPAAVFIELRTSRTQIGHVGDTVEDVYVQRIERDRVVVVRAGRAMTLTLPREQSRDDDPPGSMEQYINDEPVRRKQR